MFRSEDGAGLIFPILALCGDENGESLLGLEPEDEDRVAAEAAMVDVEVSVEGVALDALDAFLSSDQSPPDSMMLSDVDGFLTAIAIGPELIMPSEWLPVIWGDDEPVFTDEAQMQAVLGSEQSLPFCCAQADTLQESLSPVGADDCAVRVTP